ncbi:hypothetical protein Micbo1qcDRAFT_203886 [Microdochium bolleyi]|uniref:Uncharacterized protein n=1 Tax=Microdochium bolleyi TaxID=196109 RepID=A0A136J3T8_9PEZI|nr:hypothetical protein Micbo1qcDRAFT_203886 [Microdochium bolleyi]
MKLSSLLSGLLLCSLASAFPFHAPAADQALAVRQDDEQLCVRETCGAICARSPTPQSQTLSILKGLTGSFTKRAINRPAPGGLDAWFAATWPGVQHKLDIDPDYAEVYHEHSGKPTQVGLVGMYGCTGVLITTRKGVLLTHMWEKFFDHDKKLSEKGGTGSEPFRENVLSRLRDSLSCKFRSTDPGLQITIFTRANQVPDTKGKEWLFYPDQVEQIKEEIVDAIDGLEKHKIHVVQYKAISSHAGDLSKADGKIIYTYTNDADGKNAYQLWVGSRMAPDNSSPLKSSEINDPIMFDEW